MIFLDPKSDIAFKKLFGDITHKNILISFLNSVLERIEGTKITDVTMNNTYNLAETQTSKTSIVDVRCTDQAGLQYIVEMQIVTQDDYAARAQYYSSLALGRQLTKGEQYENLVPVIFVGIIDFNLFKNPNYLSHHLILDKDTHTHELKHLEFHFVELKKFNKDLSDLNNILDKWIYFLRHAVTMEKVPASLQEPILKEAFNVLAQGNWSKSELEKYDQYLDEIRSTANQLKTAKAQGEEIGKEMGKLEEKIATAKRLLRTNGIATVAEATELSIAEIEEIKKNL